MSCLQGQEDPPLSLQYGEPYCEMTAVLPKSHL